MQILIGSRIKCRKKLSYPDITVVYKQGCSTEDTVIQISPFSVMLLIVGISNYKVQFILTLCGVLLTVSAISYLYKYFWTRLKDKIELYKEITEENLKELRNYLQICRLKLNRVECEFLKLTNLSSTINQLIFFIVCERVLLPERNMTALYSLMFYNAIGYCVLYVQQLLDRQRYSFRVNVANHSNVRHLAISATKIVLEWTKAVMFVMMVGFSVFALCLQNRSEYYFQPTKLYALCTWVYYISTEKVFAEFFPALLAKVRWSKLDDLESLWAPVLLNAFTELLSLLFSCILLLYGVYHGAVLALYVNVYLSHRRLVDDSLPELYRERSAVIQFRRAAETELVELDDVCAVCLTTMDSARVTPCRHLFHTDCLRRCLQSSNSCPLCMREFVFCYRS